MQPLIKASVHLSSLSLRDFSSLSRHRYSTSIFRAGGYGLEDDA